MKRLCIVVLLTLTATTAITAQTRTSGPQIIESIIIRGNRRIPIDYEGIDSSQQADVTEEWRNQKIELSKGSEYDPVTIRRAARIMQNLLAAKQNQVVKVIPYVEQQTVNEVLVTFKVKAVNQK